MHVGSGLGNQLFRYVGSRVMALDKGEEHAMVAPELFKGSSFMNLPLTDAGLEYRIEYPAGKTVVDDPQGVTIVDGEFQGEKDFMHRIDEVREWLKVPPLDMPENTCVIGFRGGEYVGVPDLFLPKSYWEQAISLMHENHPNMIFEVHTDDPYTAKQFFPEFEVIHDVARNWTSVRYAKNLIIANSSFYILPALLNQDVDRVIAPEFWAGYNKGEWQLEENKYSKFTYI